MMDCLDRTALRQRMRALRRRLAAEAVGAGRLAAENFPAQWISEGLGDVGAYSLYRPTGSEIDPSDIGFVTGIRALPVVVRRDEALVFRAWNPGDPMQPDALGIPAPLATAQVVEPDVIFAPVLAFDRKGGRLGQGGGFYDRTITALRERKNVLVVGVAYAGQELAEVPMSAHDQPLDAILTETEFIAVAKETR